jgi:hypothetical protein
MTTRQDQSGLLVSRCMALAAKESAVDLLFHTNTETGKTDELLSDPHVNMAFIKPNTVNPSFSSYSFSDRADFDFLYIGRMGLHLRYCFDPYRPRNSAKILLPEREGVGRRSGRWNP